VTTEEWIRRMEGITNDESMSLPVRERTVIELANQAAKDLGVHNFLAARQFLEILGIRRLLQEGKRLPDGARSLQALRLPPEQP
jgi:hypothetical protein